MANNYLASSSAFCPSISKILPKAASMLAFSPETLMMILMIIILMMMTTAMTTTTTSTSPLQQMVKEV